MCILNSVYRYVKQLLPLLFAVPAEVALVGNVTWHTLSYETDEDRLAVTLTLDPHRSYTFECPVEGGSASPIENVTWFYNGGDIPDSHALQTFNDVRFKNSERYVEHYMGQVGTCILLDY